MLMWKRAIFATLIACAVLAASVSATKAPMQLIQQRPAVSLPENLVIADQFNNRVIVVDPHNRVLWSFGSGNPSLCNPGPGAIIGPNDEEQVGQFTLMAGTGVPPHTIPEMPNGCVDNRVIAVNHAGKIVWQYGEAGVTGAGVDQLNTPVCDVFLPNGHVLITDQGNERVIEVTMDKRIVWQYGMNGVIGSDFNQLNNPNCAELLANGHILIADENNDRVIEVTRARQIVWQYGAPNTPSIVNLAAFASRLPNGDTLITDSGNSRILEVNQAKHVVWSYVTNARPGSVDAPLPTRAVRLKNGLTLISDQFNHQVIAVDQAGHIAFSQGIIGVKGASFNRLYGPYDAKGVGDYTGLTPP